MKPMVHVTSELSRRMVACHKLWIPGGVASEDAIILASRNCDYGHEEDYPLSLPFFHEHLTVDCE